MRLKTLASTLALALFFSCITVSVQAAAKVPVKEKKAVKEEPKAEAPVQPAQAIVQEKAPAAVVDKLSASELIAKAWEVHFKNDVEGTLRYTQQCIDLYKEGADKEQASLKSLPKNKEEIEAVMTLNQVATAHFIQGEVYMRQGKSVEAKKAFQLVIDKYPYAQAWDQRGWYWQIADTSRKSIQKIDTAPGGIQEKSKVSTTPAIIKLYDPGTEAFINYGKYGEFKNIGTKDYQYVITDPAGLAAAAGEGVYPNTASLRADPELKKAFKEKRMDGSHWDLLQSPDLEAAFLKWANAPEPPGVKLFYTGLVLERSGLIEHAIKCYYAVVVHYPGSYGWTYWHNPWYIGEASLAKIKFLLNRNPSIGYKLEGADIKIINGYDNDPVNDIVLTWPGKFVKAAEAQKPGMKPDITQLKVKRKLGGGKVYLCQYETGDWQLFAEGKPYMIKGVTYGPTRVGESPDDKTMANWMEQDLDKNGKLDGPYDTFVDKNKNNIQDPDEASAGDFALMKEMGANTIRLYHHPMPVKKEVLRDMYNKTGIRVIMGDFLGKYALGSGAPWNPGTDYNNAEHKKNMLESVKKMVMEHKDEPYVLFWLLGNENVYGYACNADTQPDAFFKFANEVAREIKAIDPEHPVAVCNGDVISLDKFGKDSPDVDIFGTNAYRGDYGFGGIWKQVKDEADKPVFISEYGCPAFASNMDPEKAEAAQAAYHRAAWEDIVANSAFSAGAGNAIGGVAFEWVDEWWKAYEPSMHDTKGLFYGPFPDGFMHEEWLGLTGQGDGKQSPFLRQLRRAYYTYKELWN